MSLLVSRRQAESRTEKATAFKDLKGDPAGRSDGRSSPPAEKCGVCIGAVRRSQDDPGMKSAMAQAHLRRRCAVAQPGSRPLARMMRTASGVAKNSIKRRAAVLGWRRAANTGGVNDEILQFAGQRSDQVRALDRQDSHDLLKAEFGLPLARVRHGPSGQFRLGFYSLGEPKPLHETGDIKPARPVAIGHRGACKTARLKASTVAMSGFGAPERTATPIAERAMSVALPAAILPSRAGASISARGNKAMSNTAPSAIAFRNADVSPISTATLQPPARSNSGTASANRPALRRR